MNKPYDLTVPGTELVAANRWWSMLSINQMKEYRDKHAPASDWVQLGKRTIHQIWESEGKPPVND